MNTKAQFLSIVLLVMYSVMMSHNVVPHTHAHETDTHLHSHDNHVHHHDAHQHEHGVTGSLLHALAHLFSHHTHENAGDIEEDNYLGQKQLIVDNASLVIATTIVYRFQVSCLVQDKKGANTIDPPPLLFDSQEISSTAKRGPPVAA